MNELYQSRCLRLFTKHAALSGTSEYPESWRGFTPPKPRHCRRGTPVHRLDHTSPATRRMDSISDNTTNHYLSLILLPEFPTRSPGDVYCRTRDARRLILGVLYTASNKTFPKQLCSRESPARVTSPHRRARRYQAREWEVAQSTRSEPFRLSSGLLLGLRANITCVWRQTLHQPLYQLPSPTWFEIFPSSTFCGQLTTCFANPRYAV